MIPSGKGLRGGAMQVEQSAYISIYIILVYLSTLVVHRGKKYVLSHILEE
jgi:hypothetical protein